MKYEGKTASLCCINTARDIAKEAEDGWQLTYVETRKGFSQDSGEFTYPVGHFIRPKPNETSGDSPK